MSNTLKRYHDILPKPICRCTFYTWVQLAHQQASKASLQKTAACQQLLEPSLCDQSPKNSEVPVQGCAGLQVCTQR